MNRREFIGEAAASTAAISALGLFGGCHVREAEAVDEHLRLYVGTYTRDGSQGIYRARMHAQTGELTLDGLAAELVNPSFLALDPRGQFLYSVNEIGDYQGESTGSVTAFAVDPSNGDLERINVQPSMGGSPAHIVTDRTGRYVLVANYGGGNVSVLPIRYDGGLDPASDVRQHEGSGPNRARQERPHAHAVKIDAANRHAFVADLGIDRVMVYQFDPLTGVLEPASQPFSAVRPGAGPRHLDFHPNGGWLYVINELDSTMTAFEYDAELGSLEEIHTVSTLPDGFADRSSCADVHVSPDGRFLYGSNRGHDSIAVFEIDGQSGRLSPVQHQSTLGRTPRNFTLDPSGRILLAANQDSSAVVSFVVDPDTGTLAPTGHEMSVPVPVCLVFA